MIKNILYFICFSIVLAVAYLAFDVFTGHRFLLHNFWLVYVFVGGVTFIAFAGSLIGIAKSAETGVYTLLGGIVLKLLFCMVFALVYTQKFKVNDVIFVLNYISIYFIFTAFEIYCLLRNLRHQNKR